jgi:STE24 endopeptidase
MNTIAIIVLIALVGESILNFIGDYLNIRHLRDEVPDEFKEIFESEKYRLSQKYLKTRTRFGWLAAAFNLIVVLVFWFNRGFDHVDQWVRSFGYGPVFTGVLFTAVLLLARSVLSLPFSCYATFVIETKFGFNRTTVQTFVLDLIKGLLLAVILGAPILALVFAFFEYAGPHAWLFCWAAVTVFTLVVQFVAPNLIMPLFNKYTPLEEGDLRESILSYARSIDFPLSNIFIMDGSKRSSKSNAFFTGFGRNKRIVLFDTLVDQHTVDELVAVLAHEMGHYKKKHIIQSILIGIVQTGLLFFLVSFFISHQGLFEAFFMQASSVYAGLLFFGLLYAPVAFFIGLGLQAISRRHEYEADRFAVATTNAPGAMVDALKKLSVNNLSNLRPHPFYVFLNYSHPPVLERIRAIAQFQNHKTESAHVS